MRKVDELILNAKRKLVSTGVIRVELQSAIDALRSAEKNYKDSISSNEYRKWKNPGEYNYNHDKYGDEQCRNAREWIGNTLDYFKKEIFNDRNDRQD